MFIFDLQFFHLSQTHSLASLTSKYSDSELLILSTSVIPISQTWPTDSQMNSMSKKKTSYSTAQLCKVLHQNQYFTRAYMPQLRKIATLWRFQETRKGGYWWTELQHCHCKFHYINLQERNIFPQPWFPRIK